MTDRQKPDKLDTVRKVAEALGGFDANEQELILRWARELVGLSIQPLSPGSGVPSAPPPIPPPTLPQPSDIRTFYEMKKPSSDTQFAATVAYYLPL